MEERKLLIVGIDPGTTAGFAAIDVEGNLVHLDSSKQLDLNQLISKVIKLGKAVLVGTDKAKVPHLIGEFAAKLGARIIRPEGDIKVDEKRKMVCGFNVNDEHQSDALAAALFAYKEAKPLLDRIDFFVIRNKKHDIRNRIKELVMAKEISIKNAVSIIEGKDEEENIIKKVIVEKKLSEKNFLKLYGRLKECKAEIKLVKRHNNNLRNEVNNLEMKSRPEMPKDASKKIEFRENRIKFLENLTLSKEREIASLRVSVEKLNNMVSNISDYHILKKLDTLGTSEFNLRNEILNIKRNDILLVDNPNIVSYGIADFLKNRVFVIVHKKPVNRKTESLPFIFISAKSLKINENDYFGFVDKKHFEAEKNKVNWVGKIIDDYKREKEQLA